jgi:hypothetical protein
VTEIGDLIFEWLKDAYPKLGWSVGSGATKGDHPIERLEALMPDPLGGTRGLNIILEIHKMTVTAFIRTRYISRVRSVELHDPKSIDGLKELVDHVIKVCSMPTSFTKYV